MAKTNYWEKLKSLPQAVEKESGDYTGTYEFTLTVTEGTYFLSYAMGSSFGYEEWVYPASFSGDSLEEVIDKACKFFEDNFGIYKLTC